MRRQQAGKEGAELFQAISWVSRVLDFEVLVMRRARNCFIEFTEKNNSSPGSVPDFGLLDISILPNLAVKACIFRSLAVCVNDV